VAPAEGVVNETGRRLLALAGSIALVVVALFIRGRGDEDGSGSGSGGGGDDGETLVCPPELADACRAASGGDMDVQIEEAQVTADALTAAGRPGVVDGDLWLVPRAWVEAVSIPLELGGKDPVLGAPSATVARSPVVLVVASTRVDALTAGVCGGSVGWQCVGDVADGPWTDAGGESTWGKVKAGIAQPGGAAGLTLLGAAVADYLDDPGFASNDFSGPLDNWLSTLAAASGAADMPKAVDNMITRGPGELAILGTVEAAAADAFGNDAVQIIVPSPVVTSDLVAVQILGPGDDAGSSSAGDDLADDDDLREALASAGWRVDGQDLADGLDPDLALPDDAGVPQGDVLRALLQRWSELV
jgi:hypothetical protein